MNIKQVIDWLENCGYWETDHGWDDGCSYRGMYDQFSVEPAGKVVTVAQMISVLENAIGGTFTGHKGGEYTMWEDTDVYYAPHGHTGPQITKGLLKAMFIDPEFDYRDFEEEL